MKVPVITVDTDIVYFRLVGDPGETFAISESTSVRDRVWLYDTPLLPHVPFSQNTGTVGPTNSNTLGISRLPVETV